MLKKMILLVIAASILFILVTPVQSHNQNQRITPQVQIGGA